MIAAYCDKSTAAGTAGSSALAAVNAALLQFVGGTGVASWVPRTTRMCKMRSMTIGNDKWNQQRNDNHMLRVDDGE